MRFKCEIDMSNAAFDDAQELPRILRLLADAISREPESGAYIARDINGNKVGEGHYEGMITK